MMHKFYFRFVTASIISTAVFMTALAQSKAFDVSRMDTSVEACTDFYQYTNGTWLKNTKIPPAFSRWGSFFTLMDNNQAILKEILENASRTKSPAGSSAQLTGDYYASCMDEAAVEKLDINALKDDFKRIDGIKTVKELQHEIAEFHRTGESVVFGIGIGPDAKNSKINILGAGQGGLSLPTRDYYLETDQKSVETRARFLEYATKMFGMMGDSPPTAAANAELVMKIQTRLARASKSPAELRDSDANYHKKNLAELAAMTPHFSWNDYLKTLSLESVEEIDIGQPEFFMEVDKMFTDVSIKDWKTYLRWSVTDSNALDLSKRFADEHFNFYSRYLSGVKEREQRWQYCADDTDSFLGEALGQEFVKKTFSPEAKRKMNEMIDNLSAVFKERVRGVEWMSDETRQKALVKLGAFRRKIGYPDTLRGYQGLTIDRQSFFGNKSNLAAFLSKRSLRDHGQPVDPMRWGMTPPTVNAGYNVSYNSITFPAGILQPPFFNPAADDALNYGAIGSVIGHEMTHGFDDDGSKFDADGNLKSWWTTDDRAKFEDRASCVIKQFDGYEIQPGLHINGQFTLGENIADLGGVTISYLAFQKSLEGKPRPANIDGFTPEQRFFLGYGQVWATKATPEFERRQVLSDEHSNEKYRVNGPLSNIPQFAAAFSCKIPSPMVRKEACRIW